MFCIDHSKIDYKKLFEVLLHGENLVIDGRISHCYEHSKKPRTLMVSYREPCGESKYLEVVEEDLKGCYNNNWSFTLIKDGVEINIRMVQTLAVNDFKISKTQDKKTISVKTDEFQLEVKACGCGFRLGVDASYLEQVGDADVVCPSCGHIVFFVGSHDI
jgi:hypothetical protein